MFSILFIFTIIRNRVLANLNAILLQQGEIFSFLLEIYRILIAMKSYETGPCHCRKVISVKRKGGSLQEEREN
jgi:hypothetical protein